MEFEFLSMKCTVFFFFSLGNQVLTYTQQSKEMAIIEQDKLAKRIQEFRTQVELDNLRSSSNMEASTNGDGIHVVGVGSYKSIEALMQSTANGKVPYWDHNSSNDYFGLYGYCNFSHKHEERFEKKKTFTWLEDLGVRELFLSFFILIVFVGIHQSQF